MNVIDFWSNYNDNIEYLHMFGKQSGLIEDLEKDRMSWMLYAELEKYKFVKVNEEPAISLTYMYHDPEDPKYASYTVPLKILQKYVDELNSSSHGKKCSEIAKTWYNYYKLTQ